MAVIAKAAQAEHVQVQAHEPIGLRRAGLGVLTATLLFMAFGGQWDVTWHMYVGRDWFWIPPHVMVYSGVTMSGLTALMVTLAASRAGRVTLPGHWRLFVAQAPIGFALVGIGAATMIASAPFDDWWHRTYGIDVTIWSPPHLGGVLGSWLMIVGMLVESAIGPRGVSQPTGAGRLEWAAFLLAGTGLLRVAIFGNIPASQYTFWGDDFSFQIFGWRNAYLFPIMLSFFGAYAAIATARISRRPWLPLALVGLGMLVNWAAQSVADTGTDWLALWSGSAFRVERYELGFSAREIFLWPLLAMAAPYLAIGAVLHFTRRLRLAHAELLAGLAGAATLFLEFALVYISSVWPSLDLPPISSGLPSLGITALSAGLCLTLGALSGLLGGRLAARVAGALPGTSG